MDEIAIGAHVLQPGRQLMRDGERVAIGLRALSIISELARCAGAIVTKDELLSAVWPDVTIEENALQVHVTALRKALGEDGALIETIRGVGYTLRISAPDSASVSPGLSEAESSISMVDGASRTAVPHAAPNVPQIPYLVRGEKPPLHEHSLIVLPFRTLGPTGDEDYFADGLVEDVTSALSQIPHLMVISRGTAFEFRGSQASADEIARNVSVRYALTGSVRRVGNRARVSATLQDAHSAAAIWSRTYDRELDDIINVQDELAHEIVTALDVELVHGEFARVTRKRYSSADAAYELYRGMFQTYKYEKATMLEGRTHFERFIALEPTSPLGYAWLAFNWTCALLVQWEAPQDALTKMREYAQKALEIEPDNAWALISNCYVSVLMGDLHAALDFGDRAVKSTPSSEEAIFARGWVQMFLGRTDDAVESVETAIRLSPIPPTVRMGVLATIYRNAGRYGDSIHVFDQLLLRHPDFIFGYTGLAVSHQMNGDAAAARATVKEVLRRDPTYTVERFCNPDLYADSSVMEGCGDALVEAGMPRASQEA